MSFSYENRAAVFDVQHKALSLLKAPIQQNLALKCDPAELLCGIGHLNGAKALQVAANGGGVGDDKGGLPLRERIQQLPRSGVEWCRKRRVFMGASDQKFDLSIADQGEQMQKKLQFSHGKRRFPIDSLVIIGM